MLAAPDARSTSAAETWLDWEIMRLFQPWGIHALVNVLKSWQGTSEHPLYGLPRSCVARNDCSTSRASASYQSSLRGHVEI